MITRRRVFSGLFGLGALFAMAIYLLQPQHIDGVAHVYMLNVGQGDSFLIVSAEGKKLLIDGGKDTSVLNELSKVLAPGDQAIDVVMATHPDADHIGGLQLVLQRYHVGLFLTSEVSTDTKTFADLFKQIGIDATPSYYVRHGMVIALGGSTTFTILFPDRDTSAWKTNEASVVGRLNVGSRSMLFTGDSPSSVEHFLVLAEPKELHVDVLKLGHHGSKYSSSLEYLNAVGPTLGLVSAGIANSYHHPNVEMLGRLDTDHIPWISTQDKGTVELTTDGVSPWTWKSVE